MTSVLCQAVAQAGRSAATASLDLEQEWSVLLVAGWLSTAVDLVREGEPAPAAMS